MITSKDSAVASKGKATEYYGLSTDTKPTEVPNGSVFLEMDTTNVFMYDAANGEWLNLSGTDSSSSEIESNDSEES